MIYTFFSPYEGLVLISFGVIGVELNYTTTIQKDIRHGGNYYGPKNEWDSDHRHRINECERN